jgi:four helix bundle protein
MRSFRCLFRKINKKGITFLISADKAEISIMGYKDLEIWKIANELVNDIHAMTLRDLPKFEMYETGNQIRRSVKSVKSNIVEGYGRRNYKHEFLHFLTIAIASNDETLDHFETLFQTNSLKDKEKYEKLHDRIDELGRKLNLFIKSVENQHKSTK